MNKKNRFLILTISIILAFFLVSCTESETINFLLIGDWIIRNWYYIIPTVILIVIFLSMIFEILAEGLENLWEWFTDDGWKIMLFTLLIVGVVFGIIAGFVYWDWLVTLIITLALIVIGITVFIIIHIVKLNDYSEYLVKTKSDYVNMYVEDLREECRTRGLKGFSKLNKQQLIELLEKNDDIEPA